MSNELSFPECNRYYKKDLEKLRYKFSGVENIENNYSQAFQDMFVLSVLDGKKNGTYVEIGGGPGIVINNSYLLETQFNWEGVSFEIDQSTVDNYNLIRKNECMCADALEVNFSEIFKQRSFPKQIDYLQLDIDPASQTLKCLKNIPLDEYRFSVITFETDIYRDGADVAEESRQILLDFGYELIAKNVSNQSVPFEDWYVDPTVVDKELISKFKVNSQLNTDCEKVLFKE